MSSGSRHVQLAWLLAILVSGLVATSRNAAGQDTGAMAPYVSDSAIAVMRVDLARLDVAALLTDMEQSLDKLRVDAAPKALEKLRVDLNDLRTNIGKARESLVAAGARELYMTLLFKFGGEPPIVVAVTTGPGANVEELGRMMVKNVIGTGRAVSITGKNVVAAGSPAMLEGLPLKDPKRGDELARALAGDAPIQLAFIPSELVRKAFVELIPELPPQLGGGTSDVLAEGAMWGSIAITPVPGGSIRVVLHSASPRAADSLAELIRKTMGNAAEDPARLKNIPGISEIMRLLAPKAVGDRVEVTVAGADFDALKNLMLPVGIRTAKVSLEMERAIRIRTLLQECYVYAQSHKDEFPPDLETLVKGGDGYLQLAMLRKDASDPKSEPAFVYLKVPPEQQFQSSLVVIYEHYTTWPKEGIWVGFADSHVDRIADEATFKKLLEKK